MKTLFFGAGPIGSLYAHRLCQAGVDVTILARGDRYDSIRQNGLVLKSGYTGNEESSSIKVINQIGLDDEYDLVVVSIRKNKLKPAFELIRQYSGLKNILFLGNNVLGFDDYLAQLPEERIFFGFPGAGGGFEEQVVCYVDSEKSGGKRIPVRIGEANGEVKQRTQQVKQLFSQSGVPVDTIADMDGWLKYHAAFILPIAFGMKSGVKDTGDYGLIVRAGQELGNVLKNLGHTKRQPFKFNFFYWLPEFLMAKAMKGVVNSKFAEVAIGMHLKAAFDEMRELMDEFMILRNQTSVSTPTIDKLRESTRGIK
jgi:2-dehydropantoate 2-reductase